MKNKRSKQNTFSKTKKRKLSMDYVAARLNGKKVKINTDKILSERKGLNPKYQSYITKNKDTIFTAITDVRTPSCYTFVEDDDFIFYETDLIEVAVVKEVDMIEELGDVDDILQ